MKHLLLLLVVAVLGANVTSCTGVSNTSPEPSLPQSSSTDPSKGLAIYIADPGKDIGADAGCQVDLTRLSLVGNPLSEADIEFFDQGQGLFQLKVSQYDWLGGNKNAIQAMRKGGRGCYYPERGAGYGRLRNEWIQLVRLSGGQSVLFGGPYVLRPQSGAYSSFRLFIPIKH